MTSTINPRRFLLLAVMVMFLAAFGVSNFTQPAVAKHARLICCSACDVENPPLACRRGCSPSCKE